MLMLMFILTDIQTERFGGRFDINNRLLDFTSISCAQKVETHGDFQVEQLITHRKIGR